MGKQRRVRAILLVPLVACLAESGGCKSSSVTEVRGKTSFGPEFRNRGNNTSEIRYDARQAVELRWDNGWTSGVTYRRRDIDGGSGDNENLVLFEVGYPIWKAPKKPDKTVLQIEELQRQIGELQSRIAGVDSQSGHSTHMAKTDESGDRHLIEKENSDARP